MDNMFSWRKAGQVDSWPLAYIVTALGPRGDDSGFPDGFWRKRSAGLVGASAEWITESGMDHPLAKLSSGNPSWWDAEWPVLLNCTVGDVGFSEQERKANRVVSKLMRGQQSRHHRWRIRRGQRGGGWGWLRPDWPGALRTIRSRGCGPRGANTTVQKRQFFCAQLSLSPNSHIHTWPLEKP